MEDTFGKILKHIMKEGKVSQLDLADKVGMKQSAISRFVSDKHSASIDTALTLLEELDYQLAVVPKEATLPQGSFSISRSKEDE